MSGTDALSKLQFSMQTSHGQHILEAHHGSDHVGTLIMHHSGYPDDAAEVEHVGVSKEHQRKGIATAMWHEAKRRGLRPMHSEEQTAAGAAWARTVPDYP